MRRVSMMELGFADRVHSVDRADDGSHSLPDCWNVQRVRLNSLACLPAQPTLSTALITSSTSESSEDVEDEEEEKAWPLATVAEERPSAFTDDERRRRRRFRRPPRQSLLTSLLRRPSAPVWEDLPLTSRLLQKTVRFSESESRPESCWHVPQMRETKRCVEEIPGE